MSTGRCRIAWVAPGQALRPDERVSDTRCGAVRAQVLDGSLVPRLVAAHVPKLLRVPSALDVAQAPADLAIPSFRTHPLKGDLAGHWSIWVNGHWRVTFRFVDNDVELVDYQDYH